MEFLSQLHPFVVHFPIAAFMLYAVFEVTGILADNDFILKMAFVLLFIGVISSVGAVLTGNQAAEIAVMQNVEWDSLIEKHEDYATITLWYFFAILVFRTYLVLKKKFSGVLKYIFIPLVLIGSFLIYETGDHGGKLVYDYGIGTKVKQNEMSNESHSNSEIE
ncbi:MAG TPA: hypothetical protein ENN33_03365 [Ignavibacteria bacterium]|nr:hypothetical protein [Ignavibacteria bacterium]